MKLLKFSADWCGPCKMLAKTLENSDLGVPVEEIDVDENPEMAQKFHIRGVPTLVYVDDSGNEVNRISGSVPIASIKKMIGGV